MIDIHFHHKSFHNDSDSCELFFLLKFVSIYVKNQNIPKWFSKNFGTLVQKITYKQMRRSQSLENAGITLFLGYHF